MSELLLKFNQLDTFHQQELLDFLDFLLAKRKRKAQNWDEYQQRILQVSVWNEEDLAIFEENTKRFNEWQPTEW